MTARFPRKRADGSFCVLVSLRVETDDLSRLRAKVSPWLEDWAHRHSRQKWFDEEVRYEDEFAGPPAAVEWEGNRLGIRVECRPTAKWWKDLLVTGLLRDLLDAYGEVKEVERMQDCD